MTDRYATIRKALHLLVHSMRSCELGLLSGTLFIDTPSPDDLHQANVPAAQRTATSISRLPGGPGRLPTRNPTASRLRRTDPLAE